MDGGLAHNAHGAGLAVSAHCNKGIIGPGVCLYLLVYGRRKFGETAEGHGALCNLRVSLHKEDLGLYKGLSGLVVGHIHFSAFGVCAAGD